VFFGTVKEFSDDLQATVVCFGSSFDLALLVFFFSSLGGVLPALFVALALFEAELPWLTSTDY
jgi:hypothetical protein